MALRVGRLDGSLFRIQKLARLLFARALRAKGRGSEHKVHGCKNRLERQG